MLDSRHKHGVVALQYTLGTRTVQTGITVHKLRVLKKCQQRRSLDSLWNPFFIRFLLKYYKMKYNITTQRTIHVHLSAAVKRRCNNRGKEGKERWGTMGNWEFLCVCEHPKTRLATRDWTTDRHLNKGTVPVLYCLIGIDIEFQQVLC